MGKVNAIDKNSVMGQFLTQQEYFSVPAVGNVVRGTIITASKSEVRLDIDGIRTGIVRGKELYNESAEYSDLKPGDMIEATVLEVENEKGEIELSFRYAGAQRAWESLQKLMREGTVLQARVVDANKGGLMMKVQHVNGFLPVSQLIPEHYPRVEGGDKAKILEILKSFVGKDLDVKVIDANEKEDKLIVSERAAWEEDQQKLIAKYKVSDKISGKVTAVTDFGVFVEFDANMEGLVHISELAWQRIDNPRDVVKVGDTVSAEIINIDGTKIFLSMKKLIEDPWAKVSEKYKVGDIIEGKVLKANPFGLFVELDKDIHGLAHISELSTKPITSIDEIAKPGQTMQFRIVSIEPTDHRLGLSINALKEKPKKEGGEEEKDTEKKVKKESEPSVEGGEEKDAGKKEKKIKKEAGEKPTEEKTEKESLHQNGPPSADRL